jgi:hypothetical protein
MEEAAPSLLVGGPSVEVQRCQIVLIVVASLATPVQLKAVGNLVSLHLYILDQTISTFFVLTFILVQLFSYN